MPTLEALAGWEAAVLASLRGASGTLDERDRQVTRAGLYAEYPAILSGYIEHFDDERTALEALKRAVFIVWYAAVEPAPRSGIAELPEPSVRAVTHTLEAWARRGRLDREMLVMLAWYEHVLPESFELHGPHVHTATAIAAVEPTAWRDELRADGLRGRGQLGDYWRAQLAQLDAPRLPDA